MISDIVRALVAAGASPEMILGAVEAAERAQTVKEEERLAKHREHTRRWRERMKEVSSRELTANEHSGNGASLNGSGELTGTHVSHRGLSPETKAPTPLKTQPLSTQENPPKGGQKKPIPIDAWVPSGELRQFALDEGISASFFAREMDTMRDWARAKDERKKDWDAAARNWLRRAATEPRRPNGTGPPKQKSVITLAAEGLRRRGLIPEKSIEDEQFTGPSIDLAAAKASNS